MCVFSFCTCCDGPEFTSGQSSCARVSSVSSYPFTLSTGAAAQLRPCGRATCLCTAWLSSLREMAPLCARNLGCSRMLQTYPHPSPSSQVTCFSRAFGARDPSLCGMCLLRSTEPQMWNGKNANKLQHQVSAQPRTGTHFQTQGA